MGHRTTTSAVQGAGADQGLRPPRPLHPLRPHSTGRTSMRTSSNTGTGCTARTLSECLLARAFAPLAHSSARTPSLPSSLPSHRIIPATAAGRMAEAARVHRRHSRTSRPRATSPSRPCTHLHPLRPARMRTLHPRPTRLPITPTRTEEGGRARTGSSTRSTTSSPLQPPPRPTLPPPLPHPPPLGAVRTRSAGLGARLGRLIRLEVRASLLGIMG